MKVFIPWNEVEWTSTRSSGAGGQHVNKTNSAVQLRFSISKSLVLNQDQKDRILTKLAYRLIQGDEILIRIENERDQKSNKDQAYKALNLLVNEALKVPKKRIATKPKRSSIKKRLASKKIHSDLKKTRSEKIKY